MCLFVCLALKVARACQACQRDSMNGSKRFIDPTHLPIDVAMQWKINTSCIWQRDILVVSQTQGLYCPRQ